MNDDYAAMCGYTEKELEDNFKSKISAIAEREEIEYDVLLQKIKKWYDGYQFSIDGENVYIFEFKLDKSEKAALDQILNKEYYLAYQNKGKKITLVGANFNSETRCLSEWVTKAC